MNVPVLVNGREPLHRTRAITYDDRGLQYGDGLFETALLQNGRVRFLDDHLTRLETGCSRLGIDCPARATLLKEIALLTAGRDAGVLKIIVTRGAGGRGYRPTMTEPTRVLAVYPPLAKPAAPNASIGVRWCETRLSRNPMLAGIKHLNRLEQVLAQAEWDDTEIAEGLMLDTEGELVAATAGNLFLVRNGMLRTPDLRNCGIRGVMRGRVIATALALKMPVDEQPLWPQDVEQADEIFLTNAIRGVRPVSTLGAAHWPVGPITRRIATALDLW